MGMAPSRKGGLCLVPYEWCLEEGSGFRSLANGSSLGRGYPYSGRMVCESKLWNPVPAEWCLDETREILFQLDGAPQRSAEFCF